jgi:hypothetical protein
MGWHENGKSNFSGIDYRKRGWSQPHLIGYMESHDEERAAYKCSQWGNSDNPEYDISDTNIFIPRLGMNAMFFLPVPGPKLIWQFGEMSYDYSIDYNGRTGPKPVRWDYLDDIRRKTLSQIYSALAKLRIDEPAFETDDFTMSVSAPMKRIVLEHESMDVVIFGNFDNEVGQLVPGFTQTGTWYDYFTGSPFEVTTTTESITLQPGEYHMYTTVKLPVPDIGTGILDKVFQSIEEYKVYPNPVTDQLAIQINNLEYNSVEIDIVDIQGRLMQSYDDSLSSPEIRINTSSLPVGSYFAVIKSSDNIVGRTGVFIVVN